MKTFSNNSEALSLYCFSSIPQPGARVTFYDYFKNQNDGVKYSIKDLLKILKNKKFKPIKTNSFDFSCYSDGAYPFYVSVNKFKRVKAIYFELRNNCGWGSGMFYERPDRLIKEREIIKKMPDGFQLDMTIPPAAAISFKTRNRQTYYTFSNYEIDGAYFVSKDKSIKKHIGNINIKSNLIVLDDMGNIDRLDENIDKKSIYKKAIKQNQFHGVDDGLSFERIYIPVKNKNYKIYLHHINKTEKEELKDIESDNPRTGSVSPIYPIISIQDIEGCFLTKDKDGKLVFTTKKDAKISDYLKNEISKKNKYLRICQLDIEDLTSLSFVNNLKYKIDTIFLVGFEHINDWSPLLKLKNVKKILFSKCNINLEEKDWTGKHNMYQRSHIRVVKSLNKNNIITIIEGLIINLNVKIFEIKFDSGVYNGEINSSKKTFEGYGMLNLSDGNRYSGNFKDSRFHGYGSYILSSGSWYLGEWKNGIQEGSAIFISKDGFRYIGNFKNNKYHGKGEFYMEATGDKSIIEHKDGIEIPNKK